MIEGPIPDELRMLLEEISRKHAIMSDEDRDQQHQAWLSGLKPMQMPVIVMMREPIPVPVRDDQENCDTV